MVSTGHGTGIPRWVGARTQLHPPVAGSPLTLTVTLPPIRGFLWALWLDFTRPAPR